MGFGVLWTGGWDSTFAVVQSAVVDGIPVTPVYLLDAGRRSLRHEIKAMVRIRQAVTERFPNAAGLIEPTLYVDWSHVRSNESISKAWRNLNRLYDLGQQYEYLAWYAEGHDGLGLCLEKFGGRPYPLVQPAMGYVGNVRRLIKATADPDVFAVFGGLSFPVVDLTKEDMREQARQHGFAAIMEMTHFCHNPDLNGRACGRCWPCTCALREGMAYRIPWTRRYTGPSMRLAAKAVRILIPKREPA